MKNRKFEMGNVIDLKQHVANLTDTRASIVATNLEAIMKELEGDDYMNRLNDIMPKLGRDIRKGISGDEVHYTYEGISILIDPIDFRKPISIIVLKKEGNK